MEINLHWIVDVDIIEENNSDIPEYIRSLGYKFTPLSVTKKFPKFDENSDDVYIFHGSFQELRRVKNEVDVCTYGMQSSIYRSHYMSYLPSEWLLSDGIMTTWGKLCKNKEKYFNGYNEIFIRPDTGFKVFTGQVIYLNNFNDSKITLEKFSSISPETIIWICPTVNIEHEYRLWISNGKIVGSTEYSWSNDEVNGIIPDSVYELANKVANYEWQVDRIYVCDIHCNNEGNDPRIIELNSFSCSGLYQCDAKALFRQISLDIIDEWKEF